MIHNVMKKSEHYMYDVLEYAFGKTEKTLNNALMLIILWNFSL